MARSAPLQLRSQESEKEESHCQKRIRLTLPSPTASDATISENLDIDKGMASTSSASGEAGETNGSGSHSTAVPELAAIAVASPAVIAARTSGSPSDIFEAMEMRNRGGAMSESPNSASPAGLGTAYASAMSRGLGRQGGHGYMSEPPVPELDIDMSTTTDDVASSAYLASPSSVASGARGDHIVPALVPVEEHSRHQDDAVSIFHSAIETRPLVFSSVVGEDGVLSEADDEGEDDESTINSTRSVNPLDLPYTIENDRRYCGDYHMPIDEMELDRLYLFHQVYLKILDGHLTTVQLEDPTHILDIGTASGDWAMSIAEQFPDAEVTGIDIADVFERRAPVNCFWEVDDAELEWERHANTYDLIHLRNMDGAFRDWRFIYESAYRCLKPGGWIEIMDFVENKDIGGGLSSFRPESQIHSFMSEVDRAAEMAGRPRGAGHLEPRMLFESGYIDVRVTDHSIPLKLNDGNIGKTWLVAQLATLEAVGLRLLTKYMGWTAEEVRESAAEVEMELLEFARAPAGERSPALKTRVLLGRKPDGNSRWSVGSGVGHAGDDATKVLVKPTTATTIVTAERLSEGQSGQQQAQQPRIAAGENSRTAGGESAPDEET